MHVRPHPCAPLYILRGTRDALDSSRHAIRGRTAASRSCCSLVLPQFASFERSINVLRSFNVVLVAMAAFIEALSYAGSAWTLRVLAAGFGTAISMSRAAGIVASSYSLSVVWGGQLMYSSASYRWLRAAGESAEAALLTSTIPALLNIGTVGTAGLLGMAYLLARGDLPEGLYRAIAIALLVMAMLGGAVGFALGGPARLRRTLHSCGRVWAGLTRRRYDEDATDRWLEELANAFAQLRLRGWRRPLTGDVINVGCDFGALMLLFQAAGATSNPAVVLAGYGPPLLLAKVTPLPGGVGVVEGSMLAIYASLGVPSAEAVVVILGYRALSFWLPVLVGFALGPFLNRTRASAV